jgi:hypothetical protein
MQIEALSIAVPVIAGFVGGLLGVYYKESLSEAKKVRIISERIKLMILDFRNDIIGSPFEDFFLQGMIISKKYSEALAKTGSDGLRKEIDKESEIREKIRNTIKDDEDLNVKIQTLYDGTCFSSQDYVDVLIADLKKDTDEANANELNIDNICILPTHIAFQAMRYKSYYSKISKWFLNILYHTKYNLYKNKSDMLDDFITAGFTIADITNISMTLEKNVDSLLHQSTIRLALKATFGGK